MKIVVALDSFKGSLDAQTACEAVSTGLRKSMRGLTVGLKPLADGGEGTAGILLPGCGGEWRHETVIGPLPHIPVDARYAMLKRPPVVIVEMAAASGLTLLDESQRQPLKTTTFGTGQLLKAAFRLGKPVWLAVGGSATVDGGVGAAMALGWKFLDRSGKSIHLGGGQLEELATIVPPRRRHWPRVEVLCDVTNPLCGKRGAARIFGPQKGATPAAVEKLERGLRHLAVVIRRDIGIDVLQLRGGGAAGGLAAGAVAFFDAKIRSGIETIMAAIKLREAIADADWVITGEGSFDGQSLHGKVVSGVLTEARRAGVKVAVIAGRVALDDKACRSAGIAASFPLMAGRINLRYAVKHARTLVQERAREFAKQYLTVKR